jgi:hypothetical protein
MPQATPAILPIAAFGPAAVHSGSAGGSTPPVQRVPDEAAVCGQAGFAQPSKTRTKTALACPCGVKLKFSTLSPGETSAPVTMLS